MTRKKGEEEETEQPCYKQTNKKKNAKPQHVRSFRKQTKTNYIQKKKIPGRNKEQQQQ